MKRRMLCSISATAMALALLSTTPAFADPSSQKPEAGPRTVDERREGDVDRRQADNRGAVDSRAPAGAHYSSGPPPSSGSRPPGGSHPPSGSPPPSGSRPPNGAPPPGGSRPPSNSHGQPGFSSGGQNYNQHNRYNQYDHYNRHNHYNNHHYDRYYPPRGYVTPYLPYNYHTVYYGHDHYYYGGGVWYRPYGLGFAVIAPPIGVVVSFLPDFYTTYWYGGVPYYYANSVYYVRRPDVQGYVVTEAPSGEPERVEPPAAVAGEDFFMYPRNGQSADTQARDRYECHRWAVEQTGFDPTQSGGGVSADVSDVLRSDYLRAITACLDARGYTVR
jgi:hypothetical protein